MAPRAAFFCALLVVGCFPPGEGVPPPLGRVYFPVGLAVDGAGENLFVVNSDFDLQYNAGTVQSWDLDVLRDLLPRYCDADDDCDAGFSCDTLPTPANGQAPSHWCVPEDGDRSPCGALGEQSERGQALYPGRCGPIDPMDPPGDGPQILPSVNGRPSFGRAVQIGAFATDVVIRARPEFVGAGAPERLFVPVRGDATLHWIDVNDGELFCGQGGDPACDDTHRSGDASEEENTRGARLAPEPYGVAADEDGRTILVTNQTSGSVGLFAHETSVERDRDGAIVGRTVAWEGGPRYAFAVGGLPSRPIGVAALPEPLAVAVTGRERQPGYLVTFRNAPIVSLVRAFDDAAADPSRPYAQRFDSEPIFTNASGVDSRGIAVDASRRQREEALCQERFGAFDCATPDCVAELGEEAASDYRDCVEDAAALPLDVFIANRAPSSLILGRSEPVVSDRITSDLPKFYASLPLDIGASRVVVGDVKNLQGERERRVFVLCFDSRRIAVYDPVRQRLETEIVTGRGPHALAIDIGEEHAYAYVAHFTDSYIGVVDLDQRHTRQYAAIIATVGEPAPPRAAK